jgi:hypothetical protein
MWNGRFFEPSDLLVRELTLNLVHFPDDCPSVSLHTEIPILSDFDTFEEGDEYDESSELHEPTTHAGSRSHITIVSSTGIFKRSIRWCHCAKTPDDYVQLLLRAKLFPASFKNPKTAFTFEVLDHFQLDALECKTAAMNFMSKIKRITNEAFPSRVPVNVPIHQILTLSLPSPSPSGPV